MLNPNISIIMGIYNCAATLPEAIDSIIAQTYDDWELIMCDDGSIDNTFETAQKYKEKYPEKIVLLKNDKNMGLNYTLNRCLEAAKGEYVARMDGDDISLPTRFEKEVNFLNNNPNIAFVSAQMILFDESGDWGLVSNIEYPTIYDFAKKAPRFCHAPCMIRKEAYLSVGGYSVDKRLLRYEDCNLWYKLYSKGYYGYNIQEPLYKMRDDRNAISRRTFSSRMRGIYVQYIGFKMVNMPIKYYPILLVKFFKLLFIGLMPKSLYTRFHKLIH